MSTPPASPNGKGKSSQARTCYPHSFLDETKILSNKLFICGVSPRVIYILNAVNMDRETFVEVLGEVDCVDFIDSLNMTYKDWKGTILFLESEAAL